MHNYEPQNQFSESNVQKYYTNPITSTSSQSYDGYVVNTTGESYNPMNM